MKRAISLLLCMCTVAIGDASAQNDTQNPHGEIQWDCQQCHTMNSWTEMRDPSGFAHGETGFPLVGAHSKTKCASCHQDLKFASTESSCASCHSDAHRGQLGTECQTCHTPENWKSQQETFEQHAQKGFALVGVHAIADCGACHIDQMPREFAGMSTECAACHGGDFQATTNPGHQAAGFSQDCESCHGRSALTWASSSYIHPATFPLSGGHAIASCDNCHATTYSETSTDCVACHESDFDDAPDPDHVTAGFSTQCVECHTTTSWAPAELDHNLTTFPLTGAHVEVSCNTCHTSGYTGTASTCVGCHENNYATAEDPDHEAAGFPTNCVLCHNSNEWAPANLDHNLTDFPLTGAHVSVTCNSCHTSGYTGTSSDCYTCHQSDYASAPDPNHTETGISTECAGCHSTASWAPAEYDHDLSDFPLTGAHATVTCNNCHSAGFTGTATTCIACHESDYTSAGDPDHISAGFSQECTQCHSTAGWQPANLDHDVTEFPLTGAHVSVTCNSCHASGYTGTLSTCFACHGDEYANTPDPDHAAAGFAIECDQCHTAQAWTPADLDHNVTGFPLTGAHVAVSCANCHTTGFTGTQSTCIACHQSDYADASDPNHVTAGFPTECTQCHTTLAWEPASLDHSLTEFPLTGAHVSVTCENCHTSGYTGTESTCFACHESDFAEAPDPDHVAAGFPNECALCHTTAAWEPASLNHDLTDFPLTGAHTSVTCASCHTFGYAGTASECMACHQSDYADAADPNHVASGFSTTCTECHTTTAWEPADLDHNATDFPLTGAHQTAACSDCHSTGFTGTTTLCYACHVTDFTSTADPDHVGSTFSTNCAGCHTTTAWEPAAWDHNLSDFPLTGAHAGVTCNSCHVSGFTGTPTACIACHEQDYAAADDPNHVANGFATECTQCHITSAWEPATLNHDLTGFPLTGAHTAVSCVNCHATGYAATPSTCFACHETEYNDTPDPDHASAGFSTQCTPCHTTAGWTPANLDHDETGFPLTGAHLAVTCNQCHSAGYTGTVSDCMACHETDYTQAGDPSHAGFPTDCAQCHGTSAWEPATFNHNLTDFALTGQHTTISCASCHTTGYVGTPTQCDACHHSDYLATTDPNHVSAGFSTDCTQCHSSAGWAPATLDHNLTGFALTGAHQSVTCNSCHASGFTGTASACLACHTDDYTDVADPNHVTAGFPTLCEQCHTTSAWTPSSFNHNLTGFPLTGAHTSVTCASCHSAGYTGTPTQCDDCHHSDYTGVTDPDHTLAGFSTNCTQCHSTSTWDPSSWTHTQTGFGLTGAHQSVTCNSCHSTGFAGTAAACMACHSGDYAGVTDPNHVTSGFPTLCEQCHTTTAWTPSSFNHDLSGFPLTGAHTSVTCNSCHEAGYTGTPSMCDDCHHADYLGVADPNHVTAGFATLCEQCHSTTGWSPATFDHNLSGFPLTGAHTTVTCSSCHAAGYTGTPSECLACHSGDYNTASPDHLAAGFPTTCQTCHSTAAWTPANWNHDAQYFPIYSGKHREKWNDCTDCHVNPASFSTFECIFCHEHNRTDMDDKHKEEQGYQYLSTACLGCHPKGD